MSIQGGSNSKLQTAKDYEISIPKTPNRFQTLADFPSLTYSLVAANPAAKLQTTPTIQTPSSIQKSTSQQPSSSIQSPYFTKNMSETLFLTTFKEVPEYKTLLSFLTKMIPQGCQWMPDDIQKTQKFYELILVDSDSIEIAHNFDKKIPSKIAYSKCIIKKVIKPSEWGDMWFYRTFSVNFSPNKYNYNDYRMAWMRAFFLRPFDHSWFFTFHTHSLSEFPIWFYDWWYLFGPTTDILPTLVQEGFKVWIQKSKGLYYQQELQFYKEFKVPWIFCWSFKIAQMKLASRGYPMSLIREFKIKWWEKFDQNICSPTVVQEFIQTGKKYKFEVQQVSRQLFKEDQAASLKAKAVTKTIRVPEDSDSEDETMQQFIKFQKFKKLQKQLKTSKSSKASSEGSSCDPMGGPCSQDPYEL